MGRGRGSVMGVAASPVRARASAPTTADPLRRGGEPLALTLPQYRQTGVRLGEALFAHVNAMAERGLRHSPLGAPKTSGRSGSTVSERLFKKGLHGYRFQLDGREAVVQCHNYNDGFKGDRSWADLIVRWGGQRFFYNYKAGDPNDPGNVNGGLRMLAYLLGAPMENSSLPEEQTEESLAELVDDILAGDPRIAGNVREYFLLCHPKKSDDPTAGRVLPLTALRPKDIIVNKQNGLQVAWGKAEAEVERSPEETARLVCDKVMDYFEARAAPWERLRHHREY